MICKTADSETAFCVIFPSQHMSTYIFTLLSVCIGESPSVFYLQKIILSLELEEHIRLGFLLFWKTMVLSKKYTA